MATVTPAQIEDFKNKLTNLGEVFTQCAGAISSTLYSTLPESGVSHPKVVENLQSLSAMVNSKRDKYLNLQEETKNALNNLKANIDTYIEASASTLEKNDTML